MPGCAALGGAQTRPGRRGLRSSRGARGAEVGRALGRPAPSGERLQRVVWERRPQLCLRGTRGGERRPSASTGRLAGQERLARQLHLVRQTPRGGRASRSACKRQLAGRPALPRPQGAVEPSSQLFFFLPAAGPRVMGRVPEGR